MDKIIYEYTDENNKPLYRQNRYYKNGDKSFYSEKYVDGKWIKGIDGVERVLFKLPQIKEAISKGEKIYFVEGEKDVLTLQEKGKVATTIAGGANQKWQQSYTNSLKGADIVIIPDNDKVGQEFAMKVADSLTGNVGIIKLLDLTKKWPDLKEKGDITDVFEMVNNDKEVLEKLQELEEETTIYIKSPKKIEKINTELCIEEFDLKLKLPKFYEASKEKGVSRYYYSEEGKKNTVKVAPILIVIDKILKNIDTMEEKAELLFFKKGKWEKLIVDKNILCNSNNIVTLANKGIPVTSSTSRELVNWLYNLEIANYNEIKQEKTINRMGWINDTTFVPYNCKEVSVDFETGVKTWLKGLSERKGSVEEWKSSIKSFLNDDELGFIRFMIATRIQLLFVTYFKSKRYNY